MTTEKTDALATREPELPEPVVRRGVTEAAWRTLCNNLFPGAHPKSVLMVLDYCSARGLDPLKKPVHIVPMQVKVGDEYVWRDVVLPGVYEYRTTAHRTGEYLGHEKPEYGPEVEYMGVKAPDWCEYTVYRWNDKAKTKIPFTVTVFFPEVVGTTYDRKTQSQKINSRWARAPRQMLAKCAEAAALREAFPEEIGGEPTAEEMDGQVQHSSVIDVKADAPKSAGILAFEQLPEAMQDTIERAFGAVGLTQAQRLTKLNEFFGAKGVDMSVAPEGLLIWCEEETKKRANGQPRKASVDNNKKAPTVTSNAEAVVQPPQAVTVPSPGHPREPEKSSGPNDGDSATSPAKVSLFDGVEF